MTVRSSALTFTISISFIVHDCCPIIIHPHPVLLLTCGDWWTWWIRARQILQVTFERVGAADVVAGIATPAQRASVRRQGETVGAKHSAGVIRARFWCWNNHLYYLRGNKVKFLIAKPEILDGWLSFNPDLN